MSDKAEHSANTPLDPLQVLGDIDAWNLRQEGDWLRFTARLDPDLGPRDYLRNPAGGDVIAVAPGPLYGILSIGGARRAGFNDGPSHFPRHIFAPGDHIGAVGLEGTDKAIASDQLQKVPHKTQDALIAQTLLSWRVEAFAALPLFLVRTETDASSTAAALAEGLAFDNFFAAVESLRLAARKLGKAPKVLAVGIDYGAEDVASSQAEIESGLRALMTKIEAGLHQRGLQRPIFLLACEGGQGAASNHPAILAHTRLSWLKDGHTIAIGAPGYAFERDRFGRPTDDARLRMAEMDAHAIVALTARQEWTCPCPLLAEYDDKDIRVTFNAMEPLVIDPALTDDPSAGFAIAGSKKPLEIVSAKVDPRDPKAILLRTKTSIKGEEPLLRYALPGMAEDGASKRGAIRDSWSAQSAGSAAPLHRWALPAELPLNEAPK